MSLSLTSVVLFLIFRVVCLQLSPPNIPETFSTDFLEVNTANKSLNAIGRAVEDTEKELVYLGRREEHSSITFIFNKMLYRTIREGNGNLRCNCLNITFKEARYPLFGFVEDLEVLYFQNETVEVWEPEDQSKVPVLGKELIYFIVKKTNRNVPFRISQKFLFKGRIYYQNTTFSDYNAATPDPSAFKVPDVCADVKCTKPPTREPRGANAAPVGVFGIEW